MQNGGAFSYTIKQKLNLNFDPSTNNAVFEKGISNVSAFNAVFKAYMRDMEEN